MSNEKNKIIVPDGTFELPKEFFECNIEQPKEWGIKIIGDNEADKELQRIRAELGEDKFWEFLKNRMLPLK